MNKKIECYDSSIISLIAIFNAKYIFVKVSIINRTRYHFN